MNRENLIKIVMILFCFFVFINIDVVNAESCSSKELNTLKQLASNIKFTYELHDDTYNEAHTYYFDIYATNFSKEFYFKDLDGQKFMYMSTLEKDGIRELRIIREGFLYSVDIYTSNATKCPNTKIMTKKMQIPYYNDYSQREECTGIEEFSLCQKYYDGYIPSDDYFLEQVNKYKNGEITKSNEEKGIIDIIVDFITGNLLLVIPAIIVLIVIIIVVITKIRKSKKRVKIKI